MGMTSPFFTGRQDILQRLESFFSVRDTAGKPRREFLLHGMGGVGKTEVAMKFSEIHEDRYVLLSCQVFSLIVPNIRQIQVHLLYRWIYALHNLPKLC
jgi:chloramphenicol 3-O-phosphotransferase